MILQRFLHISQAKLVVVHSETERGPSSTSGEAAILSRSEEESTTVVITCQAKHLADCSLLGHRSRAPNVRVWLSRILAAAQQVRQSLSRDQ
jgi:hypothetical protein